MTRRRAEHSRNLKLEKAKREAADRRILAEEDLEIAPRPSEGMRPPNLPYDLAEQDDEYLIELFVTLTRWADYLAGQLTLAEIDADNAAHVHDVAEATALISAWGGKRDDSVTVAKAERTLDPVVEEQWDELHVAYARRKLLQTMFETSERRAKMVSRELSRREALEPPTRRADRWGGGR